MATRDESIDIHVDSARIAGTLVRPAPRLPGVLFVHGWGGSQEQYLARAHEIAALGCFCLTFDLRGHAGTHGQHETVTRESNLRDVLAAYDVLASHPQTDPDAIAVVGSSYGGYMAAMLTALRPVRWLALRAPALYPDDGWHLPKRQLHKGDDLEIYRRSVVPPGDNRALRACSRFAGDVLVVESECDKVIPHPVITSYVEACSRARSLTYRVISRADHGLSDDASQRAYTALLVNWMREMVRGDLLEPVAAEPPQHAIDPVQSRAA
ncbi:MAG TPA: alpha/beta fold hydrolase [Noviherbaspirillum sp.]|nr:alpha/beta fold hydrolase [Noviherbaspirillum sp.]